MKVCFSESVNHFGIERFGILFEPEHNKAYKVTSIPSKDSDRPVQPHSLVRGLAESSMGSQGSRLIHADRKY